MVEQQDPSQLVFLALAAVVIILFAARGWRLGLVRQALNIVAVVAAYAGAYFGAKFLIPVLRPIGFPDQILMGIGGLIAGLVIFVGLSIVWAVLFKRTAHQGSALVRYGFGISGAVLGAAFGLFLVLLGAVGIRLLGSIAEHELSGNKRRNAASNPVATRLARIKRSISQGATGAVVAKVDPIPTDVYSLLGKVGEMTSDPESLSRFGDNPNVRALSAHPKIVALQNDPEIAKAVEAQDFLTLLRNPKLVSAANDPEVIRLVGALDLNKALDFALKPSQKPAARSH
jgi:uncharacterized membrane protein required for colicin V production